MLESKVYINNILELSNKLSELKKKSNIWSYIRITVFIGGFATITLLSDKLDANYLIALSVLFFIILIIAVVQHLKISKKIESTNKLLKINKNEISVIKQEENFYPKGENYAIEHSELSNDLDLFGDNSVYHFINRANTYFGVNKLKEYLIEFSHSDVILERQQAVAELSGKNTWRQNFQKELFDISYQNTYSKLIDFVKSSSFVADNTTKFTVIFYQNTILLLLYISSLFLFSEYSFTLFLLLFAINSVINLIYSSRINNIHNLVSNNAKDLAAFYESSKLIEGQEWSSNLLKTMVNNNADFSYQIIILKKLIQKFDFRLNMLMGAILNILFLWDIRIISKLDKWKKSNVDIEKHLKVIGEFEALNSLATLKFNNQELCFPEISKNKFEVEATDMYHPLIYKGDVISNSYNFVGRSRLDIITGPNMSGKSTFLRSIAINMILAGAGSIVFAKSFVFTPSKILTYLHITDSVTDKISTFRAEIIKLKSILDELETSKVPTFFILDEILRGTNSHSKFKGSVAIVKRLLELESSGIIATHDVKLGEMEYEFKKEIRNFSFDFIVDDKEELVYDYKLKEGINTKVNAEIVLKELGLVL